MTGTWRNHSSHGGAFLARPNDEGGLEAAPHPLDTGDAPHVRNIADTVRHPARVARPAIRRGWLEEGPGPSDRRGREPFVEVEWDELIDLLSAELRRVYRDHGAQAVFGGSYGWASAGRFHHAPSQVHRFLNALGGYTASVNTYSLGATAVLLPHVIGRDTAAIAQRATSWSSIADNTEVLLAFGGMATKNATVSPGGATDHVAEQWIATMRERGVEFHLFSPLRDDLPVDSRWWALRPATDTAVMLGLLHTIVVNDRHDLGFLTTHCEGWERLERYLLGLDDGVPKDVEWAAAISGLDAAALRTLALSLPGRRVLVQTSWSLQRAEHGEQPLWASIALAAALGQVGLPGGGFGHGYGSMASVGLAEVATGIPALPQGSNPVRTFIPVARGADLLRHPGEQYDYDGKRLTYPDIRLVYWCGGNPFHHHQDLFALREAWSRPDTVVVHEPWWTASAKHADIVVPSTITLERDDIGGQANDRWLHAMQAALPAFEQSRNDYDVFADLAEGVLGNRDAFTEGRSAEEWVRHLYSELAARCSRVGWELPGFDDFWAAGHAELPMKGHDTVLLADFRADPAGRPLATPSGRIELFSASIDSFGYDDMPGHPVWMEPQEWLGSALATQFPLHLIANQPASRLHSQLDMGSESRSTKTSGRETLRMSPPDAESRGLVDGTVALVRSERGACLAGVLVSDAVSPGTVQLSTGSWFAPAVIDGITLCTNGNVNVLTADRGTSRLAQGCTGQHALVEVQAWPGEAPWVDPYCPPEMLALSP